MESFLIDDVTLADLSRLIQHREVSATEVLETYLSRIAAQDAVHHAFRTVLVDQARREAAQRDAELEQGIWRGPLHGIPIAVKNNIDIAGEVTSAGSRVYSPDPALQDARVIQNLRDAGAVILGHTHMVEFAFGGWGTNTATGTPRNPLDPLRHRVPGGSSSGSGVAVAARLVPLALGTDTGGSVRIPAAMVGITAFKPSWGVVSDEGLTALCKQLDVVGPMAHTVSDCWTLFRGLLPADCGLPEAPALPVRPLRIGVVDPTRYGSCSDRVLTAFQDTCRVLANAGLNLEPFELPMKVDELLARTGCLIGYEAVSRFGDVLAYAPDQLDRGVYYRLTDAQQRFDVNAYDLEVRIRTEKCDQMRETMASFDALLLPTTPILPASVDEIIERGMPLGDLTRVVNYFDMCAMALPTTHTEDGLRHSIQVIGAHGDDDLIFSLSLLVEKMLAEHYGESHAAG